MAKIQSSNYKSVMAFLSPENPIVWRGPHSLKSLQHDFDALCERPIASETPSSDCQAFDQNI